MVLSKDGMIQLHGDEESMVGGGVQNQQIPTG